MLTKLLHGPRQFDLLAESRFAEIVFRGTALLAIVLLSRLSWGPLTDAPALTSDDFSWVFHAKYKSADYVTLGMTPPAPIPLWKQLVEQFIDSDVGHYEPIAYGIWSIEHKIGGDAGFVKVDYVVTHAFHCLAAFLTVIVLRRFSFSRAAALAAAALVIAHPVNDISLGGVNGALILRATTFLLIAVVFWLRGAPGEPRRPGSLVAAGFALFLSLNTHPFMLAAGPLLLLFLTLIACVKRGMAWRSFLIAAVLRSSPLWIAYGFTLYLRLHFYGTILVKAERALTPLDRGNAMYELWANFCRLAMPYDSNRGKMPWSDEMLAPVAEAVRASPRYFWAAVVGCVVVAGAALFDRTDRARVLLKDCIIGFAATASFLLATLVPLYFARGDAIVLHRYLFIALPGVAALGVLIWSAVSAFLPRIIKSLGAGALVYWALTAVADASAEATGSILFCQKATTAVVKAAGEAVWERPEIQRCYILNFPLTFGRGGLMLVRNTAFEKAIEFELAKRVGSVRRPFSEDPDAEFDHHDEAFQIWPRLLKSAEERRRTVIFYFDQDTMTVKRVRSLRTKAKKPEPLIFEAGGEVDLLCVERKKWRIQKVEPVPADEVIGDRAESRPSIEGLSLEDSALLLGDSRTPESTRLELVDRVVASKDPRAAVLFASVKRSEPANSAVVEKLAEIGDFAADIFDRDLKPFVRQKKFAKAVRYEFRMADRNWRSLRPFDRTAVEITVLNRSGETLKGGRAPGSPHIELVVQTGRTKPYGWDYYGDPVGVPLPEEGIPAEGSWTFVVAVAMPSRYLDLAILPRLMVGAENPTDLSAEQNRDKRRFVISLPGASIGERRKKK